MTGYGRSSNEYFSVEIQSVNHRFCEITLKAPPQIFSFENKIKDLIKNKIQRGKFYIFVNYEKGIVPIVDKKSAIENLKFWQELAIELGLENDLKLSHLISMKDTLNKGKGAVDTSDVWQHLEKILLKALNKLIVMRKAEGEKIKTEFKERIAILNELLVQIQEKAPQVPLIYKEKLKIRLNDLMTKDVLDETRLAQEIAIYADKCDITEELVRLQSHICQFEETLNQSESMGRSLDFLTQEINRELNTIGSKANDLQIIQVVLKGKNELEKIKEQLANVE